MPEDILTSVPVPPESLPSASAPSLDLNSDYKSGTDDAHYTGTIQRFFQSEVRPVYFGNKLGESRLLFVYSFSLR